MSFVEYSTVFDVEHSGLANSVSGRMDLAMPQRIIWEIVVLKDTGE